MEAINKIIKHTVKAHLNSLKGAYADELLNVLWSYWTTLLTSIGEIPFSLEFGVEVVILIEMEMPSFQTTCFEENNNKEVLVIEFNLSEEKRKEAELRTTI